MHVLHPALLSSLNPFHILTFSALFFILPSLLSPDSISSLSSLRIPSSLLSLFLSWSNSVHLCVHTPGCRGNGGRPHKRVDEQKTRRPSSTEMEREGGRERKIKFHMYISIFLGEGGLACVRKVRGRWRKGLLGGLDSIGAVSSFWERERERERGEGRCG